MDITELKELAEQVAYELEFLRGEGWKLGRLGPAGDSWPAAWLDGADGAVLELRYGFEAPGRVTITGIFPPRTGGRCHFSANVNPERGAQIIARAADNRVLQAGYLDVLPGAIRERAEIDRKEAARAELLGQVAALFGAEAADYGDGRKVFLGEFIAGNGYVETYLGDPDTLSFNLSGIPAGTALRMLAVLAEDTAGRKSRSAS